jgi:hypothetical protein
MGIGGKPLHVYTSIGAVPAQGYAGAHGLRSWSATSTIDIGNPFGLPLQG